MEGARKILQFIRPGTVIEFSEGSEKEIGLQKIIVHINIEVAVIINIRDISSHGIHADVIRILFYLFTERPISLVDVHVVTFRKIISDKNIGESVVVEVRCNYA